MGEYNKTKISALKRQHVLLNFVNTITELIKEGFYPRKNEIAEIENLLKNYPNMIIICSDLNSTPYGYAYQKLKKNITIHSKIPHLDLHTTNSPGLLE